MSDYGRFLFAKNLIKISSSFLNCTKLAKLAIKVYVGKNKMNSAKKLPPVGIEPGMYYVHFDAFLTELTWQVLIEGYLTSHLVCEPIDFWI